MGLTKAQLEALNQSSFPDNQEELITPEVLRTYNAASIDNTVNQDTYTTDSASFDSRINGFVAGTGFLSTASFNAYTASTNSEISAIESFTASVSTSVGLLQTFSGSQYKIDSASFSSRINTAGNTGLVTTASFNAYTSSNDTKVNNLTAATSSYAISSSVKTVTDSLQTQINGLATTSSVNTLSQSVDSRLDTLETAGYVTATITGSSLVTASVSQSTITFTKGDGSQFNIVVADISGGASINTGSFATTGSNNFIGNQIITGSLLVSSSLTANVGVTLPQGLFAQTYIDQRTRGIRIYNSDNFSETFLQLGQNSPAGGVVLSQQNSRLGINVSTTITGNITASGDISASGNIYGANLTGSGVPSGTVSSSAQITAFGFATTSSVESLSASIAVTNNTQSDLINGKLDTSSFNTFSSSYVNESASFSSRIEAIDDDNVTTASFNQYTQSTDNRLNSIESFTASVSTSVGLLQTFSGSQYKGDSASFDSRIDNLEIASGGFATTASVNALSASIYQTDATQSNDITALSASNAFDHSRFATTGSNTFNGNQTINGDISSSGTLTVNVITASAAQITYLHTLYETSSVVYSSGSNQLGDELTDVQILSGSVEIVGSGSINGSRIITSLDTASMAVSSSTYAVTASYALNAQTASEARNLVIIARNGNQSTLSAGTVVRITSAVGDNPIFNTASYDTEALSSNTLGILGTSIASGEDGEVVVNGIVLGVNTDPVLGYVAGDVLYLSASGQFTRVQPQAPLQIVTLGEVLRAQQNNGSIYVNVSNGWELNELHNVQINTPLTNDLLAYESSSYGLWKNKTYSELGLATTSSVNSISTSVGLLQTFSGSEYKADSASFNSRIIAATGSTINTGSFAITGSNIFVGNQLITNGAIQSANYTETNSQIVAPTVFQGVGTSSVAYEQYINGGNYDCIHIQSNASAGTDFQDLTSNTFTLQTWLNIPTNTGNNPAPQFKRGLGITGSTSVNGAVQISSSATYDLDITGAFQASAASRVSSSAGIGTIAATFLQTTSGSFSNGASSIIGRGYTQASFNGNTITMFASGGTGIGGVGSAPLGSSGIAINSGSIPNTFYYPILFQSSPGYTDGRVTFTTPIQANSDITASSILLTGFGTTNIQYNQPSTGSVNGQFATSYGKDNLKVYQYQGQPYAFNVNLTANQANAYTGSQFEWALQLNGNNVSLPGGGGTYFAMVSGSTTGSTGDPGLDKKGLNYLGTAMILDMYADTSFRRAVYVDKGMFVSQSQGGGHPALTVDGTNAAGGKAIIVTGSVDITGSLSINGTALFTPSYGSFTGSAVSSGVLTTYNQEFASGVEIVSSSFARVLQTGIYQVTANAQFDAAGGSGNSEVFLKKNGTTIVATTMSGYTSAGEALSGVSTTALVQLNAFEYVEVGINPDDDSLVSGRLSIVRIA